MRMPIWWYTLVLLTVLALLAMTMTGCANPTAPPAVEQVDGTIVETCDDLLRNFTEC